MLVQSHIPVPHSSSIIQSHVPVPCSSGESSPVFRDARGDMGTVATSYVNSAHISHVALKAMLQLLLVWLITINCHTAVRA